MVKVSVKWGKEVFNDLEVDLNEPPIAFKSQLFSLSGVPPERQKVLIKGGQLKDDAWGKQTPKDGMSIMMMGSADAVAVVAPANAPTFLEDLPESEQEVAETRAYGSGLNNLGNTCYMNSTVQCLYSVEGLRDALSGYTPATSDADSRLVAATKELFGDLKKGGPAFTPFRFLLSLRERYPQFAQQQNGVYMQQDAEECFSNLLFILREQLKDAKGNSAVDKLFGLRLHTKLKCDESGEESQESTTAYVLKCNISLEVNLLHQGLQLALTEDREKNSEALGRLALFKGTSQLGQLPPYLNVQLMRFFYKQEVQQKAKILRKVAFPIELDLYDFCTPELRAKLDGPRAAHKAYEDEQIETRKRARKGDDAAQAPAEANGKATEPAPAAAAGEADTDMKDAPAGTAADGADGASAAASSSSAPERALTGKYTLAGVLTHKGRSADSGHYVAWVKQGDGSWVCFDDEKIIPRTAEDVLALSGGGDWHMAYLLLYQAVRAP